MPNLQAVCSAVVHLMCKVMIFTAQLNADRSYFNILFYSGALNAQHVLLAKNTKSTIMQAHKVPFSFAVKHCWTQHCSTQHQCCNYAQTVASVSDMHDR